ncbi:hypothetical protein A1O3_03563 [Capronia epimyces CBS 606.96]|uniref:BZIP domain-containing protein n=1 Tax=Capronia epimyces CBS 606.96 TaxID=1182542 RepID=W9YAD3_9EURO|nr:uncharacterized protein A1O3_03563 [Capronia epimyces CBS 606.96]EXJ86610.1 hypothetical protein A1O3_03563 [Capronia epimyces CBS 606.96]
MLTVDQDRVANRREQLRKAQKTFKERRDQYLQTLEQQVRRLQLTESQLQSRVDQLQQELLLVNEELRSRSDQSKRKRRGQYENAWGYVPAGIMSLDQGQESNRLHVSVDPDPNPIPLYGKGIEIENGNRNRNATSTLVWVEAQNDKPYQLHVQLTPPTSTSSDSAWPLTPVTDTSLRPSPQDPYASHQKEPQQEWSGGDARALGSLDRSFLVESSQALVAQLDGVVVAMELERPCLPHICQPGDDQTAPHGHVHTATAALLCNAPSANLSSCASWSAPTAVLSRLLAMSTDLPIEGSELTPIQVWHLIKATPNFDTIRIDHLTFISDKLLSHIRCYG